MSKRKTARLFSIGTKPSFGRVIEGGELAELLKRSINFRLAYIREELNEIYPDQFTVKESAEKAGLSNQGLRDIEIKMITKKMPQKPRKDTLEKLRELYNVPKELFLEDGPESETGPFFLGKEEDKEDFFNNYYITYRQQHELDDRDLKAGYDDSYLYVNHEGLYPYGEDVIFLDETRYKLDQISLEVRIQVYQISTDTLLSERRIGQKTTILPNQQYSLEGLIEAELQQLAQNFERRNPSASGEEDSYSIAINRLLSQYKAEQHKAANALYNSLRMLKPNIVAE